MTHEEQAWADGLKVGDKVLLIDHNGQQIVKVARFTKTQIEVACGGGDCQYTQKFRRDDLDKVGGDRWNMTSIGPITDVARKEMAAARIYSRFNAVRNMKLPVSVMVDILAIVDAHTAAQKEA
jgi:hypothetical protein